MLVPSALARGSTLRLADEPHPRNWRVGDGQDVAGGSFALPKAPEAIIVTTPDGMIVYFNPASEKVATPSRRRR
jgi:PAS domain-containing protein